MSLNDNLLNRGMEDLISRFEQPGAAFRGKPFWSWNGELEKKEILRQVHILKEMGFGGYFMHSRTGLATEYLGDEWFELINAAADEGEKLGLEAWLYDEDRWPSGSAGGKVTVDPQYRMKSLVLSEMDMDRFFWDDQVYAAFVARLDGLNLYAYRQLQPGEEPRQAVLGLETREPGTWKVLRFDIVPDPCSSNYNGTTYIDTMSLKATRKFIEMTHEQYKKRCGDRLGRSIKGIFSDEPHRGHTLDDRRVEDGVMKCSVSWTEDVFEEFERRYGYDALPQIPELFYHPGGEKVAPLKLHYIDLCCNLFNERFMAPIDQWCRENGVEFTGHVLHEDSLTNQTVPNGSLMRTYEHMGYPGVDTLTEGHRGYWVVKQLASTTRQTGKKWRLSELYGCSGWQFTFKGQKAAGDWEALFGINLRCPHLSWYTMEGESKRDYPASILHQSPWYRDYDLIESYFARFGVLMTEGEAACDVLVLNPIESVWCQAYAGWANWIFSVDEAVSALEKRYEQLFHMLTGSQIDFDYGEEEMLSRLAAVERDKDGAPVLRVGQMRYKTVMVSGMLTMRPSTVALLREFLDAGGRVIFAGEPPAYMDAERSPEPAALAELAGAVRVPFEREPLTAAVRAGSAYALAAVSEKGTPDPDLFCQWRLCREDGCQVVALLNTDREQPRERVTLPIPVEGPISIEEWDLLTGRRYGVTAVISQGKAEITTSLTPAGVRMFVLRPEAVPPLPQRPAYRTVSETRVEGLVGYALNEETPCVLDFAKWRFDGGEWQPEQEVLRVDAAVRDCIGLEHRGGTMLQPWYAKNHDARVYGDLELEYEFYVDAVPEGPLYLAAERPELNDYCLNGTRLHCPNPDSFWVDVCFKRLPVDPALLRIGRNTVTVKTAFRRTSNIEAVYLLGKFGVELEGHRKSVTTLPDRIGFGNLDAFRLPFYTGGVTYELSPALLEETRKAAANSDRVVLSPAAFTGSLFKVYADGELLQRVGWEPYEVDVTEALQAGKALAVELVGTRKNTFGPLHLVPVVDAGCGPEHFVTTGDRWTDNYNLLDSGIHGGIVFKIQTKQ